MIFRKMDKDQVTEIIRVGQLHLRFVFKIYKKDIVKQKKGYFEAEEDRPIEKIRRECKFWSNMVNDHLPRLYSWLERDNNIIAIGE